MAEIVVGEEEGESISSAIAENWLLCIWEEEDEEGLMNMDELTIQTKLLLFGRSYECPNFSPFSPCSAGATHDIKKQYFYCFYL